MPVHFRPILSKLVGRSYQILRASLNNYQVRNVRISTGVKTRNLFDINLGKQGKLSHRRLLGIRGVRPDKSFLDVYGNSGTPNSGDILSYDLNGSIVDS